MHSRFVRAFHRVQTPDSRKSAAKNDYTKIRIVKAYRVAHYGYRQVAETNVETCERLIARPRRGGLQLAIPIMPTPYAAGSDIGTKSVPQQKIFFGAVIFDLGGRATMLRGRLRRIGWRTGRHQGSCDKDERLGGRRAAQSPAPSCVAHRATPPGVISLSWRS